MGRPPKPLGTYGAITFTTLPNGRVAARTRFRDFDGVSRLVERRAGSRTAAHNALTADLRERQYAGQVGQITPDMKVRELAAVWLTEVDNSNRAQGTRDLYRRMTENYVVTGLGDQRLREVTVGNVDHFIKAVAGRNGRATAKTCRTCLSQMFALAVRHDVLRTNPVDGVSELPGPKRVSRALTDDEAADLLEKLRADHLAVAHGLPDLALFMLGTGCRIGEALALLMDDVTLDAVEDTGTVHIRATMTDRGRQETTKTRTGDRVLPVPAHVVRMFRRRLADPEIATDVCAFPTVKGHMWDTSNVAAHLRRAFNRAGYPWVSSHTFRKTVATRLDAAGFSARQAADQLGHAQVSMTTDVYYGRKMATPAIAEALDRPGL